MQEWFIGCPIHYYVIEYKEETQPTWRIVSNNIRSEEESIIIRLVIMMPNNIISNNISISIMSNHIRSSIIITFFRIFMEIWLNFLHNPTQNHSSYLSQPPQPTVVYFFWGGVLFSIENAKFWPFLAYFDYFYMLLHFYRLFCREFTHFLVYFVQA